ncbi:MAG: hypothetical protein C0172_01625 [Caldisphaera sp.]|nr:MAG: hypothetical protein C0172_01625 [Caldisphaera sp.]
MWPKACGVAYYPATGNGPKAESINGWLAFLGYTLITQGEGLSILSIDKESGSYISGLFGKITPDVYV